MARGALLKGDWNIVHIARANGGVGDCDDGWELFNMVVDPGETHDLAPQYPDKLAELLYHWDEYVMECVVVWGEAAVESGQDREAAPELWEDEFALQSARMGARAGAYLVQR